MGKFVSTNDILTSWFLKSDKLTFGIMAVNMRGRMTGITNTLAGNYEYSLHYFPQQYSTPLGIRKALVNKAGLRTSRSDFSSVFERLRTRHGLVTNWASVHQDLVLPGCKQIVHMPIIDSPPMFGGCLVIFKATAEQLGMYLIGQPSVLEPILKSEAISEFVT